MEADPLVEFAEAPIFGLREYKSKQCMFCNAPADTHFAHVAGQMMRIWTKCSTNVVQSYALETVWKYYNDYYCKPVREIAELRVKIAAHESHVPEHPEDEPMYICTLEEVRAHFLEHVWSPRKDRVSGFSIGWDVPEHTERRAFVEYAQDPQGKWKPFTRPT